SCYVLLNKPIALNDARSPEFDRDMALWMGSAYPQTSSISVRGNGIAYPYHLGGKFLVSATAIYPLQPTSYPRLQPAKPVKITPITPLYPVSTALEPVKRNGHSPDSEQTKSKQAKAAASTRQKKTSTSTRRVARKNTKMAK